MWPGSGFITVLIYGQGHGSLLDDAILTEAGDPILTEAGDILLRET